VQLSSRPRSTAGRLQIRRGLLYMLLAGVIQYFAGGYSSFTVPVGVLRSLPDTRSRHVSERTGSAALTGFYLRAKS